MPHIHTKPGQHDVTASAFIFDVSGERPRVWLHKHKLLGMWMQFGGHVELYENPWQAVCHEIVEESGFALSQLKLLQPKLHPTRDPKLGFLPLPATISAHQFPGAEHFHDDIEYAFVTTEQPAAPVGDGESAELKLFTSDEFKQLDEGQIPANLGVAITFVFESLLGVWEQVDIWQITDSVLE